MRRWSGGLADYAKEGIADSYLFGQAIDYRTDPNSLTLLPASLKESGSVVTDFVKWMDTVSSDLSVYAFGDTGNLYKRTSAGSWSNLHTFANSHGNGLAYFAGDDYLYAANDDTLGRYGPLSGSPTFTNDFLKAQGGVPTNTASLLLASASSMYATAADSSSLSVTGNLTLEAYFKATTLPTIGNSMTLMGKWDESGATRSYKLDILAISGYFGDGSDEDLMVSVNTIQAPIDSACSGTSGSTSLTATNAVFRAGKPCLIHQTQGTGAGTWERNVIQGYTAGTITLQNPLNATYGTGAQVIQLKQYGNVTVNSGITWTAKAWNGTTGGILVFLASGTVTGTERMTAYGCGFRGGAGATSQNTVGYCGEGTAGASTQTTTHNGNGGGGGTYSPNDRGRGGSGGGHATAGHGGGNDAYGNPGIIVGSADLTSLNLGGGGGGGGCGASGHSGINGGNGGGIIFIIGTTVTIAGSIVADGVKASDTADGLIGGGGGGAGGSVLIKCQTATLGTGLITSLAGQRTINSGDNNDSGGDGSVGRIHIDYYTSYTGTTNPTLDYAQDNTLVTTSSYQSRLGISNDGTAYEYLTQVIPTLSTGVWNRLSASWTASTSTVRFLLNGVYYGSSVGTKTAIHDNTSLFYLGANKTSVAANFFNGKLNDVRVWANAQTDGQIYANNNLQLTGNEGGLKAYWTLNSVYTDKSGNTNTLTPVNSPTFDTSDVPYPAPTTRLDIDQSYTTTGQTYAVGTTISEASTDMLSFTPLYDPQKSVDLNIAAKGTGNWTVTVHDQQNKVVASVTVANVTLATSGYYEFIFSSPWRIVINKTYHIHVTSTVADGTLVSSTTNDLSKGDFHTYFGFLVNDTSYHPIARFLNKIVIGNERYLATWDGAFYNPNLIAFPPQTHVRCYGFWREYIAFGTWQEAASGTPNIYDWPIGKIYFWDGISLTFNFFVDVAEGQVNALQGIDTNLYISAGWTGQITSYQGGYVYASNNTMTAKVKKIPFLERESYLEIMPQALCMWRSLLHIGVAGNSNSTTLHKGVYSWGTLNPLYPETLSYDYPISTDNQGSTVRIGCVYPSGQTLLIAWKDGAAYGVDQVNFLNNPPASYGTLEGLVQDLGSLWDFQAPLKAEATFLPLRTGESVNVKYQIDRQGWNLVNASPDVTVGSMNTEGDIPNGRGREFQLGLTIYQTGGTSPTILSLDGLINNLNSEKQF